MKCTEMFVIKNIKFRQLPEKLVCGRRPMERECLQRSIYIFPASTLNITMEHENFRPEIEQFSFQECDVPPF